MKAKRTCPHCRRLIAKLNEEKKRQDTIQFHYNYVMDNLPAIFKDKQAILNMVPRLIQWAKNAEHDRTATRKAEQEMDALVKIFKKRTKR